MGLGAFCELERVERTFVLTVGDDGLLLGSGWKGVEMWMGEDGRRWLGWREMPSVL